MRRQLHEQLYEEHNSILFTEANEISEAFLPIVLIRYVQQTTQLRLIFVSVIYH